MIGAVTAEQMAPPDPSSIMQGYSPMVPRRPGRYLVRNPDGRFQRGITVVRHSLGGLVAVPDAPRADCRPLAEVRPGDLLWLEIP